MLIPDQAPSSDLMAKGGATLVPTIITRSAPATEICAAARGVPRRPTRAQAVNAASTSTDRIFGPFRPGISPPVTEVLGRHRRRGVASAATSGPTWPADLHPHDSAAVCAST